MLNNRPPQSGLYSVYAERKGRIETVLYLEHTITLQPVESEPRWFRWYLVARTVLFFGAGIFGVIVTLGSDDSVAGHIISGAFTVALFYYGVRALRLLRVH